MIVFDGSGATQQPEAHVLTAMLALWERIPIQHYCLVLSAMLGMDH